MYYAINGVSFTNHPIGSFQTQPIISYNGGGAINITANMTGTAITGFTITNGGGYFTSAPTIVLSGSTSGYSYTTCTLTNGVITAITLPLTGGNNNFSSAPTVSVYGGGLPSFTASLNPYNITIGGYSLYQNFKRLRFDFNQ